MTLRKEYSPEALEEMYYNDPLSYHDQVDTCDWYFDRDYAVHSYLTDYQRLVLANGDVSGLCPNIPLLPFGLIICSFELQFFCHRSEFS
jgi:hypothetical protein